MQIYNAIVMLMVAISLAAVLLWVLQDAPNPYWPVARLFIGLFSVTAFVMVALALRTHLV